MSADSSIQELADAWIAAQECSLHDAPAIQQVIHLSLEDAELGWSFVENVHAKQVSEKVRTMLAVGPLEDLLVYFPEQVFPRVKNLAARDETFRALLRNVWLDGNDSPIWREFYELAGSEPPFRPGWDKDAD